MRQYGCNIATLVEAKMWKAQRTLYSYKILPIHKAIWTRYFKKINIYISPLPLTKPKDFITMNKRDDDKVDKIILN